MELAELRLLDALAYLLGVLAIPCFLLPKLVGLSYGRYVSPSTSMCQVPARVAWSLQELPSLIVPLYLCAGTEAERLHCWPNRLLLAMFLIHYVQRCLVYPFLIRGGKPTPLYIFLLATLFCTYNGYMQSQYLSQYAVYADDWVTDPRFLIGSVLWLVGMLINLHSDHILRCLRKPGETSYKIPQGGLFELVTAANYFGEVVEWGGFALASWSVQSGTFALFTFCFLFSRAQVHHQATPERPYTCVFTRRICDFSNHMREFYSDHLTKYICAGRMASWKKFNTFSKSGTWRSSKLIQNSEKL